MNYVDPLVRHGLGRCRYGVPCDVRTGYSWILSALPSPDAVAACYARGSEA